MVFERGSGFASFNRGVKLEPTWFQKAEMALLAVLLLLVVGGERWVVGGGGRGRGWWSCVVVVVGGRWWVDTGRPTTRLDPHGRMSDHTEAPDDY